MAWCCGLKLRLFPEGKSLALVVLRAQAQVPIMSAAGVDAFACSFVGDTVSSVPGCPLTP